MRFLVTLLLASVLLGSFCQKKPQPILRIRAEQLMYEYLRDSVASDSKYKNKELFVKGTIVKTEPDNGVVVFRGAPSAISNVVICHFQDSLTRDSIRQAFNGQEIIVQGGAQRCTCKVATKWSVRSVP
jgi:tRNA_anti-like